MNDYDLIIIGSGPAGLTAALYASRAGLKTVVFEENKLGGAIVDAELVENFPCFPKGLSGIELSTNLVSQVMDQGVDIKLGTVTGIDLIQDDLKRVNTTEGDFLGKALIIAGGARPKKLGIPGEDKYEGSGVSYCAYCDGNRFENKEIALIGGGDGGVSEGLYMTRIATKVTLIEIMPKLTACKVLQQRALANSKMEILRSTMVEEITYDGDLINLRLKSVETGKNWNIKVSGIFILAGLDPRNEYFKAVVVLDDSGFIVVNHNMETNIPGIFAAGDIRSGSARQAITAAGDGATAAIAAEKFIAMERKSHTDLE